MSKIGALFCCSVLSAWALWGCGDDSSGGAPGGSGSAGLAGGGSGQSEGGSHAGANTVVAGGDGSGATATTIGGDGNGGAPVNEAGSGAVVEGGASGAATGGAGGDRDVGGAGGAFSCGTPTQCTAVWEENASKHFDDLLEGDAAELEAFLRAVPKGGDLHNHLTGAVYAETYLTWAQADGYCINSATLAAKIGCGGVSDLAVPTSGSLYDDIVRAWSMKDFIFGSSESGRDHFLATFGKVGAIAGVHRADSVADVATRAADENQVYVETMFSLGLNVGNLSANLSAGTLGAADLTALYDSITSHAGFASALAKDVDTVTKTRADYRMALGCSGVNPPAACEVGVRFVAQVSRTGAAGQVFGQLLSAFEVAKQTPYLVALNLAGPEDDPGALDKYALQLAMLDLLHEKYTTAGISPLHVTLHAGELTPQSAVPKDHIRKAIDIGHAERVGHGVDVLEEDASNALLSDLSARKVLVEVCLSSNAQVLGVSGTAHPLAAYIAGGVPVALATDDQGVSRSSLAGEYLLAARDQAVGYRQLKRMARDSVEHAFLPGDSLWTSLTNVMAVAACAATDARGIGESPDATCQAFLDGSERAQAQWELERRFRVFEGQQ